MRAEIRNEMSPVVSRAVNISRTPGAQSFESGGGRSGLSAPADLASHEVVDDGGGIQTGWDFMLSVDSLGDPLAALRVQGNTKNYGS
jgi:hypothetical protein